MDKPLSERVRNLEYDGYYPRWLDLASQIEVLESALAEKEKENAALRDRCSMRGARMQILRDYIPCTVWHQDVLYERPEAADWFDADGVPK